MERRIQLATNAKTKMINETTLDKLLELIKKDCPPNKSWSVAVRTYALEQQIYIQRFKGVTDEESMHRQAYEKVQEYYKT